MGGKRKITITIDESVYQKFLERTKTEGFGRPSTLIRHLAVSDINNNSGDSRVVKVRVDNYKDIASYVREKKLGKIEVFAGYAMEQYMSRYPLSEAQKRRVEQSIQK